MEYIYSRVSTDKQDTENQLHTLRHRYPNAHVTEETGSGYKEKPVLNALLARLQRDDVIIVAALDRLGRHARKALALIEDLSHRGIKVVSLREGIDTASSSGKFVATCMFGLAEMERNLISERVKAAMTAKNEVLSKNGSYLAKDGRTVTSLGRPNSITDSVKSTIFELRAKGLRIKDIAKETKVSTGRICQLLKGA